MDDVDTECIMCGSHINAGTYPPVCCDHCRWEFEIEVAHHRAILREMEKKNEKQT